MKQWTRQGVIGYFCTPVTQPYHNSKEKICESAKERRKIKNGNKYALKKKIANYKQIYTWLSLHPKPNYQYKPNSVCWKESKY